MYIIKLTVTGIGLKNATWTVNTVFLCHFILPVSLKDGAYYYYCAYVLRISRYSDFLSVMPANTGIFLRGLKLSGKSIS